MFRSVVSTFLPRLQVHAFNTDQWLNAQAFSRRAKLAPYSTVTCISIAAYFEVLLLLAQNLPCLDIPHSWVCRMKPSFEFDKRHIEDLANVVVLCSDKTKIELFQPRHKALIMDCPLVVDG